MFVPKQLLAGALVLGLSACALGAAERPPSLSDPSNPDAPESPPYRMATLSGLGTRPAAEPSAPPSSGPAPGSAHPGHGAHSPAPEAPDAGTPSSTLYVCPMHPEVTSREPGRCPQCGMKLVPREPPAPSGDAR